MKILSGLILLLIPFSLLSQKAPIKWKEIPMEDLQMSIYELEPSAPAAVLCDYGQIYFNTNSNGRTLFVMYERHLRIKILNTEGLKYAKYRLSFINMSCEQLYNENPVIIKGMVYNISEKGDLLASKLKNKEIKYKDTSNCMRIAEINFPDVKPGSIIDLIYTKPTLDFIQPESWYFQREIPTRYSEIRMRAPRAFRYIFPAPNISKFDTFEETSYSGSTIPFFQDISGTQMRFVMNNIESFTSTDFITTPKDYMQKLNFHLEFAKQENMDPRWRYLTHRLMITTVEDYDEYEPIQKASISYPAGYIIYKLPDWEKFNNKLLGSKEFGLALITYWDYKNYLDGIIKDKITSKEKMIAIYDNVRKKIRWNNVYNTEVNSVHSKFINKVYTKLTNKQLKEKSLSEPLENKEGTSSEINFVLIYLLNKAGIEAHPLILSTRDNGKIDNNIPDLNQFNHLLAYVDLGESQILLDATDSLRPYQFLDKNDLNSVGYLIKGKDFGWINIVNSKLPETNITESISIDEYLNFTRKTNISDNIYNSIEYRKKMMNEGKEKFISDFKSQFFPDDNYSQTEINNIETDSLPLNITLMQKGQLPVGEEIKIHPNFMPVYKAENFEEIERKCPVDFIYPFKQNYLLELNLPDGYIAELPMNEELSTYGNQASYQYSAKSDGNKILIKISLNILLAEFPALEYSNLKDLFSKLNEKMNESIVIKKQGLN